MAVLEGKVLQNSSIMTTVVVSEYGI